MKLRWLLCLFKHKACPCGRTGIPLHCVRCGLIRWDGKL